MRRSLLSLVTVLSAAACSDLPAQSYQGAPSVIDGDTLEIHGQRFRLHGIDAPESGQICQAPDGRPWRCGQQAALALADRIEDAVVRCEQTDTDRYGRIVAVCYRGDLDLNGWMVRNGYALAYRAYSDDYVAAERAARWSGVGVWRGEFVPPWDWRNGVRLRSSSPRQDGSHGPNPARQADRDCSDFDSWREAQAFFEAAGPGDPHRLDGDDDGRACETLR